MEVSRIPVIKIFPGGCQIDRIRQRIIDGISQHVLFESGFCQESFNSSPSFSTRISSGAAGAVSSNQDKRRKLCRIFIIFILQLIVYPFRIVEDIRTTEECTAGPSVITAVVDLIRYIVDGPVCPLLSTSGTRPIRGTTRRPLQLSTQLSTNGEKVIMQVIHHRDDHILLPVLHPHFRILEDTFISRPSGVRNTFDAVILAERRTADLYPRLLPISPSHKCGKPSY